MKVILRVFSCLLILGAIASCEEDEVVESVVVTEEILFIGGDKVRMSARVLAIANGGIEDHGFMVATDESFGNPIVVSLGERSIPGRFIGEATDLSPKTDYFLKSFVTSSGNMTFGKSTAFTTLGPFITDYSPTIAVTSQVITIKGGNFTPGTEVYFGDSKAEIFSIDFESVIKVKVPPIVDNFSVELKVVLGTEELVFPELFEYVIGKWENVGSFINDNHYYQSFFFQSDEKLLFGLGIARGLGDNDKVWELDFNSSQWTETNFSGASSNYAFGANGFFGSGILEEFRDNFIPSFDFWSYDVSTGDIVQLPSLPFGVAKSITMVIEGELYLFGGQDTNFIDTRSYYRYDGNGVWTELGIAPITVNSDYPSFQINDISYFIDPDGAVYQYSANTDSWTELSQYPEAINPEGISVVANSKAYVGMFSDGHHRIWEYDPSLNSWKKKISYPGDIRKFNVAWWSYNNEVYVMRADLSLGGSTGAMEIWNFSPETF